MELRGRPGIAILRCVDLGKGKGKGADIGGNLAGASKQIKRHSGNWCRYVLQRVDRAVGRVRKNHHRSIYAATYGSDHDWASISVPVRILSGRGREYWWQRPRRVDAIAISIPTTEKKASNCDPRVRSRVTCHAVICPASIRTSREYACSATSLYVFECSKQRC